MAKRKCSKAAQAAIDRLGALDAKLADLRAERDALAERIKNLGNGYYEGAKYSALVTTGAAASLNVEALVRDYDIADIDNYKNRTTFPRLTISARDKQ
jgi:histidinol-phosphate/aromatic aminotransferase/cobyric acid decarboxylase-like protein